MTPRALILGLIGIAAVSFLISWAELVANSIQIGLHQLPAAALGMFFLIIAGNQLVRRLRKRWALSGSELLAVYCMLLLGGMVSSRGLMERWLPLQVAGNYHANETNQWQHVYFPYIKPWLVPWDTSGPPKQDVARWFYEGLPEGKSIPWHLWLRPLACSAILVVSIWFAFLCLSTILRRQWADNEKLTFPLAQLPVEMVRAGSEGGLFFRHKLMWIGFAIPAIIHSINGFANIYPSLPNISLKVLLNQYFKAPPWNAMSYFVANFSFAGIGFFYLLPAEITLSFWSFYLLGKLEDVIALMFGAQPQRAVHATANDYLAYQTSGAFFVLAGYLLWLAWPGVKEALRRRERAGEELLPYRVALGGFAVSVMAAVAWATTAGFSLSFAAFEILVYVLVQAVIMARATAEAGLLMTEGCFTPLDIYGLAANKAAVGPSTLTALSWTQGMLTRDLRGITVTGFLDGQKAADSLGVSRRSLLWAFAAGLLGATLIGGLIQMWLPYHRGAVTMYDYM
jgi:hypothetical protein